MIYSNFIFFVFFIFFNHINILKQLIKLNLFDEEIYSPIFRDCIGKKKKKKKFFLFILL